jgi:hypothetical protein
MLVDACHIDHKNWDPFQYLVVQPLHQHGVTPASASFMYTMDPDQGPIDLETSHLLLGASCSPRWLQVLADFCEPPPQHASESVPVGLIPSMQMNIYVATLPSSRILATQERVGS